MESRPEKSVLILLTNSFAAINLIHTGLLKKLSDKMDIHLLSTLVNQKEMDFLNRHFCMQVKLVTAEIPEPSGIILFMRKVQKLLFALHFDIETEQIKMPALMMIYKRVVKALSLNWFNLYLLKQLRRWIIRLSRTKCKLFFPSKYAGVISTSPFDIRENAIVNVLSRQGSRSLAIIISWDNLTSKGVINADHNHVLVWNQLMYAEFSRFYSIYQVPTKLCIAGIPRFDNYFDTNQTQDLPREHNNSAGTEKVILFTTGAAKHFADQTYMLRDLLDYCESRGNVKLWLRCHPADSPAQYSQYRENKYLYICGEAEGRVSFSRWLPPLDFQDSLTRALLRCDVCVQAASTIRIDAAACNKPVFSMIYDKQPNFRYQHSVRRLYDYSHQLALNNLGVDTRITCKTDLFHHLDRVLSDTYIQPDQRALIQPFTHFIEPRAIPATIKFIEEWLDC